ncbi:hypothetical protein ODJ79_03930 [Actinoplanes sp. KI2]|uniref:hypothetical protein n=1 Tax=Actinoplanes sp. KI2 TaxID=2983315 RepID=UPI0021D5CDF4|nr:hypothetical protein [Actinoplanes sp. KI2]MCU7722855.1 hypothetical protein [Actinoplanes sp. KI2]
MTAQVTQARIDEGSAGPIAAEQEAAAMVAAHDWRAMSARLASLPPASEYRLVLMRQLGDAAAQDDRWLWDWVAHEPANAAALAVQINYVVSVAWDVRTAGQSDQVNREQWQTFFRTLRNAQMILDRATTADPADPGPLIAMQSAAMGLQWSNDEYRDLLGKIRERAPHSYTSHQRAMRYFLPRWFGSLDQVEQYVEGALADAPLGTALTAVRLEMLYLEFRPKEGPARTEFYRGARFNQALDAGIADAAAADSAHPGLPYLRHWLAHGLWQAGRPAEGAVQFRALGDYCGADPWNWYGDQTGTFREARDACYAAG